MTTILVAGATGLVGSLVVAQTLADARVERVVALTRRPIVAGGKLVNVVAELGDLPADAPWWAVDGVVCALGTTRARTPAPSEYRAIDHDAPLAIARCARAAGATRFALVSSLGADPRSRFGYTRLKGELETALAAVGYPSITVLRPSMPVGERAEARAGERMFLALFRLAGPLLPRAWRVSPAAVVAAAALEGALAGPAGKRVVANAAMS